MLWARASEPNLFIATWGEQICCLISFAYIPKTKEKAKRVTEAGEEKKSLYI